MAETNALARANALVSPTWHRLAMNEARIDVPADANPQVAFEGLEGLEGKPGALDAAVEAAWAARPEQAETQHNTAEVEEQPVDLDKAAPSPVTRDLPQAFETGMGLEAFTWLREAAGAARVVATKPGQAAAPVIVRVSGVAGAASVAALDVVAAEDSSVSVLIVFDAPTPDEGAPADGSLGALGCTLRVYAGPRAQVSISSVHVAGDAWTTLDDTGLFLDDAARIDVHHTVLGAGASYVGLAGNLSGQAANVCVATRYVGHGAESLDFNYLLRHRGAKTSCRMDAQGVLTDESSKVLRGTIDLAHGAKGADGTETETVLLADDGVSNKSLPIILCSEDDVAGNHGATIGHMRPEQLNYLMTRGLSREAAEKLFAVAAFEETAIDVHDALVRASIARIAQEAGIPIQLDDIVAETL